MKHTKGAILFVVSVLTLGVFGFQIVESIAEQRENLQITPDRVVLSPDLIKNPLSFIGSGWKPKEMVVIDLLIPKGIEVVGVSKGEDRVGIALANADERGEFATKMGGLAIMNVFLQVGYSPDPQTKLIKPDFGKATPLPPGKYELVATGYESGKVCSTYLEVLSPPKEK